LNKLVILSLAAIAFSLMVGLILTWLQQRSLASKNGCRLLVGQPAKPPTALLEALRGLFASCPNVRAAYLAQVYAPSPHGRPQPVIGLEMAEGLQALQEEAGILCRQYLTEDESIDFMPIGADTVSEYMKKQTKPFYVREPAT
jgi:hypothetical protein